jgi:hypothetical protein
MKTEPMALATGVDFATASPIAPEANAYASGKAALSSGQSSVPQFVPSETPSSSVALDFVSETKPESSEHDSVSASPPEVKAADTSPLGSWEQALAHVDGMVADYASLVVKFECEYKPASQSVSEINLWTALFPRGAEMAMRHCNEPTNRKSLEAAMQKTVGHSIHLVMQMSDLPPKVTNSTPKPVAPVVNQPTLVRKYSEHPLVKSLLKSIDGDIVRVDIKS